MMNSRLSKVSMAIVMAASPMSGVVYGANFEGPDSVENTIAEQKAQKKSWRESLAEDGFTFGADYFALGLTSGDGAGGDSVNASSGVARLYGSWHLLGKDTQNSGSLVWKVEHRHAYGDTAPKDYSFGPLGYVGAIGPAYSDQGFRVTDLNWKQKINDGKGTIVVGWQDVTNYADVYALASPWSGFTNLAFSTGSGAMGLPDDGVLALSAGHMLGENFYVVGGIADANGKSDEIFDGFDTAFGSDASYFTTLELGWTASQEQIYTDNFHVTFWDFGDDTRHSNSLSAEGGSGVNFSWSQFTSDQVMPFVRGGFSEGDVALYDKSISVGMGYFGLGKPTNNLGVALNWAEVNGDSFAADAKAISGSTEQWTAEVYYNMQFGDHFQVTPDIQYIKDPAFSNESSAWVFGIRARVFI
ncbi:Porin [Vibrio chagasii]|nr:Porin [Vibrio chagasii]CAH6838235.1 Porin [Vibrio chagasii]CAH6858393.1 Porin [Vibrio chagasii]CAH6862784.1 Porin [Vibrio chagasii]CAH6880728.1 Porin [Vibrio chagasii]